MKSYPFNASNPYRTACTEVISVAAAMFVGLALAGLTSLPALAPVPCATSTTTIARVLPVSPVVTTAPLVATLTTAAPDLVVGQP